MNEQLPTFEKPVNDYLRVATVSPEVAIAAPAVNVETITEAYEAAKAEQAELVALPELSTTGYSAADLFYNTHVLERSDEALQTLAARTEGGPALFVGAPIRHNSVLYNCAVMLAEGKIAGIVPKVFLPNNGEFYEKRWFTSGEDITGQTTKIGDQEVPFGTDLLFEVNGTKVGSEVCEDMFAAISPGTQAALAGAHVIVNLSASNEVIGKPPKRHLLAGSFACRLVCGYVYVSAGRGESIADAIYGGHQFIYENQNLTAEREPLSTDYTPLVHDIDRTYIEHDRFNNGTWAQQAQAVQKAQPYRTINIAVNQPTDGTLRRYVDARPHLPAKPEAIDDRCSKIYEMGSAAVAQRITDAKAKAIVIGLSGGLDSTQALLIAVDACARLGLPNSFIHTITMPGFASTSQTQDVATELATALGTTHQVIPINELSTGMLDSIGHDLETEDVTYENTQARTRTAILMNYSNMVGGFELGTGDMSEKAIGYCTFNADHISNYNPNAGLMKTMFKPLIDWRLRQFEDETIRQPLRIIRDTEANAELKSKHLAKTTDEIVGPVELRDFFFREAAYGSRPNKIGYLALEGFKDTFDKATIAQWLNVYFPMYTNSQHKRNVAEDGPKYGTDDVSPRAGLRQAPNTSQEWFK